MAGVTIERRRRMRRYYYLRRAPTLRYRLAHLPTVLMDGLPLACVECGRLDRRSMKLGWCQACERRWERDKAQPRTLVNRICKTWRSDEYAIRAAIWVLEHRPTPYPHRMTLAVDLVAKGETRLEAAASLEVSYVALTQACLRAGLVAKRGRPPGRKKAP